MKTDLSIAELRALVEIVGERVDPNLGRGDPPRLLREVQQKLDVIILKHRREQRAAAKTPRKKRR
jgi:hypothetical protein